MLAHLHYITKLYTWGQLTAVLAECVRNMLGEKDAFKLFHRFCTFGFVMLLLFICMSYFMVLLHLVIFFHEVIILYFTQLFLIFNFIYFQFSILYIHICTF